MGGISLGVRRWVVSSEWIAAVMTVTVVIACGSEDGPILTVLHDLDTVPRYELQEVQRIGSRDDPDYGFSSIGWMLDVDREGNVYVFEARDIEVRVYSSNGELLRRIGGAGEGPGEFAGWTVTGGVSGDTLWAMDWHNRRLTLFDLEGDVRSVARVEDVRVLVPSVGGWVRIVPEFLSPEGFLIGGRGSSLRTTPPQPVELPRVRFDLGGQVVDTVGTSPYPMHPAPQVISVGGSDYTLPRPPGLTPLWIPTADGHVVIAQEGPEPGKALRITRLSHSADTLHTRMFGYQPKPFPDSVLDATAAQAADRGPSENFAVALTAIRRQMDFPQFQLPVQGYEVTADGGVWLRRENLGGEYVRWTVLDADLDPVGEIAVPRGVRILRASTDGLWTAEPDEMGVPWLVHYRIAPG